MRGISVLSVWLKLVEAVLITRLDSYIVPRDTQAGFRAGFGVDDHLSSLLRTLESRSEYKKPTAACFLDFSSAFFSLYRYKIWATLREIGVPNDYVNLMERIYHTTYATVVLADGSKSEVVERHRGVAEGGLFSPRLFNACLESAITKALDKAELILGYRPGVYAGTLSLLELLYADDIVIITDDIKSMQIVISCIEEEASFLGLHLNPNKCQLLTTTDLVQDYQASPLSASGSTIPCVFSATYLGVQIDITGPNMLGVKERIRKANAAFSMHYKRLYGNKKIRLQTRVAVYMAVVRSILFYGLHHFPMTKAIEASIDVFDRRCLRRMSKGWQLTPNGWRARSNQWLYDMTQTKPASYIISVRRLSWLGHVARMPPSRLPFRVLSAAADPPSSWTRTRGRPSTTWLRQINGDLNSRGVFSADSFMPRTLWSWVKRRSSDRNRWKNIVVMCPT
jgi:hypothetical protein